MSQIIKINSYLPEDLVTNQELISRYNLDSSDEWIYQRTGIKTRYFANQSQTVADLAIEATKRLLSECDSSIVLKIKLIIVATMSSKLPTPSVANQVQAAIQAENAWGFDINGACSAFVSALDIAEKFACTYDDCYTLVIGAEKMSDILNFEDRGSCILFGDGAGAILIKNTASSFKKYRSELYATDQNAEAIALGSKTNHLMTMQGKEVFNFVGRTVVQSLKQFIEHDLIESKFMICHQANQRLLDLIGKKLNISNESIPSNITQVANLSAASIPVLMHQLVQQKQLLLDETIHVTLCGFGGGLAWGIISLTI